MLFVYGHDSQPQGQIEMSMFVAKWRDVLLHHLNMCCLHGNSIAFFTCNGNSGPVGVVYIFCLAWMGRPLSHSY